MNFEILELSFIVIKVTSSSQNFKIENKSFLPSWVIIQIVKELVKCFKCCVCVFTYWLTAWKSKYLYLKKCTIEHIFE